MFFLIPWRVDVPQDRWPVMNWLILLALVAVFSLQVRDRIEYDMQQNSRPRSLPPRASPPAPTAPSNEQQRRGWSETPGISQDLILRGWGLRGLFGYMWLHGGVLHLLGNMLFLWIFGNALCAKLGNVRYLGLYVLFGVLAGIAQLLSHALPALGASGAINGVVGAYLVLFYENEITCLFMFWLLIPLYIRWFAVSSMWMIFFWLFWDVAGVLFPGDSHVGHVAHLGGFGAGFGIAFLMCKQGWITMEKHEKSLLQMWEERKRERQKEPLEATYARLGLRMTEEELQQETANSVTPPELAAMPPSPSETEPAPFHPGAEGFIRTACACGNPIRVTRQYAGRTVRCPRCRRSVVVPDKTDFFGPAPALPPVVVSKPEKAQDKHIRFICTCGKKLKAPARYGGRSIKCPHCGISLKIPNLVP
jgi:membrane associated rhomboid family serine protease/DNA-directed RNA polymerase subunit RPC12/RpoP